MVSRRALGSVAGIVGAGGNAGAVAAGFLFRGSIPWPTAFFVLGALVTASAFLAFAVRFNAAVETEERPAPETAHAGRRVGLGDVRPAGAVG